MGTLRLIEEEKIELQTIMNEMGVKTQNGAIRKMISEYLEKEKEISDLKWQVEEMGKQVNHFAKKQENFISAFEDLKSF